MGKKHIDLGTHRVGTSLSNNMKSWLAYPKMYQVVSQIEINYKSNNPSKIEWDLTNGPLSKLLELLDTQVSGSVQWVLLEISWK